MKVVRRKDAPARLIHEEERIYYLFDRLELIISKVPVNYAQPLHRHRQLYELYYVIQGSVVIQEGDDRCEISEGDSVLIEPSEAYHTVENVGPISALMVTVKVIPDKQSTRQLLESDKDSI